MFIGEVRAPPQGVVVRDRLQHSFNGEPGVDEPVDQRRDRAMVFPHAVDEPMLLAPPLIGIVVQRPMRLPSPSRAQPAVGSTAV